MVFSKFQFPIDFPAYADTVLVCPADLKSADRRGSRGLPVPEAVNKKV